MERIPSVVQKAFAIVFLGCFFVGCQNRATPFSNPFLSPDRVPPPAQLTPGMAAPYYDENNAAAPIVTPNGNIAPIAPGPTSAIPSDSQGNVAASGWQRPSTTSATPRVDITQPNYTFASASPIATMLPFDAGSQVRLAANEVNTSPRSANQNPWGTPPPATSTGPAATVAQAPSAWTTTGTTGTGATAIAPPQQGVYSTQIDQTPRYLAGPQPAANGMVYAPPTVQVVPQAYPPGVVPQQGQPFGGTTSPNYPPGAYYPPLQPGQHIPMPMTADPNCCDPCGGGYSDVSRPVGGIPQSGESLMASESTTAEGWHSPSDSRIAANISLLDQGDARTTFAVNRPMIAPSFHQD